MPINTNNTNTNTSNNTNNKPSRIEFELSEARYSLTDLILPKRTQSELNRAIGLQQYQKDIFQQWGFDQTHKYDNKMIINLYGEPGTGKTMAAHAIAHQLNRPLVLINYGDIESKYVGETPKNIKSAFDFAKENNAILFFDEADAILSRRVTNMTSATDTSVNQTRSVMLTLLNDYNDVVLFATNFISNYDPAFMRRILMHIEFTLPDVETRLQLFKQYIPEKLPHNINIDEVATLSETLSGSDIANSMLLAAFSAKTEGKAHLDNEDLIAQITSIKNSKLANSNSKGIISVERRDVSEEYVQQQLNKKEI